MPDKAQKPHVKVNLERGTPATPKQHEAWKRAWMRLLKAKGEGQSND